MNVLTRDNEFYPFPERDKSNQHLCTIFLQALHFNIILQSTLKYPEWRISFRCPDLVSYGVHSTTISSVFDYFGGRYEL